MCYILYAVESKKESEVKKMIKKVKWFNDAKGYGFLDNGDMEDIFVHYSQINQKFLMTFLNSPQAIEMYGKMKKGGARDNLSLQNIAELQIPIAPKSLQNQFATFVEQVDKSKVAVQKALDEAQTLFDSLMQEYFG